MSRSVSAGVTTTAGSAGELAARSPARRDDPGLAIVAEGLVKRFGKVTALDGVDLHVPYGSVLALLGPNGSGKTTTIRILTTLLVPDAGRAVVAGIDAVKAPARVRPLIGMAGQYAAIDPKLTGRENLIMVGRLAMLTRSAARQRADHLLTQFHLQDVADRFSRTYSGGIRRRLDLAAALVHRPKLLFFDEPTTGLDPGSRRDLWAVMEQLVAGGATILLTTQYLDEADRLADQVVVLDHGQIIAQGTPAQLKAGLGSSVVDLSFPDETIAARAVHALAGANRPAQRGDHVEIPVTGNTESAMSILRTLQAHDLSPTSFAMREPSLDDVFLELTGHHTTEATDHQEVAKR
jgi:daunorubicin resistance ABC transporter ATP-binding subunit